MDRKVYRLSDNVIAQVVRLIQLGILTGTDVSDHFRQIVVEPGEKEGYLNLTPEYIEKEQKDIDASFDHLEELMEKTEATETMQSVLTPTPYKN